MFLCQALRPSLSIQPRILESQQIAFLALFTFLPGKKLPITTEPE